ncbi:MAG: ABC transporter substrate-binding protein [Alphaproteobacteria bacterium]
MVNPGIRGPVRRFVGAAVVGGLAIGLIAGGPALAADTKIGALMPMTGALQAYGTTSLNGVKLAIEQINAQGGVLGGKLRLAVGDTQTNPQAGVDAAQKLVSVEGVVGIVGALASGVSIPVATSVTSVAGVPQISSASTSPVLTGLDDKDFLFRTVPHDALQGVVLADVVKKNGLSKVGIIYVNNDYGDGLQKSFSAAFAKLGGTVTASLPYEEKKASYRGELSRIASGKPQALVLIGYPEDGTPILRQSLEGGFFKKFVFTDGMKAPEIIKAIGAQYLNGSIGTAPEAVADSPTAATFKKAYEARFGELPPKPFIDTAYDAAFILALAIEKAGSNDPKKVRDALRAVAGPPGIKIAPGQWETAKAALAAGKDVDYVGAAGSQDFDGKGDVPGTFGIWTIAAGKIKTLEVVEPKM